jgi:hypothetical protein
LPTSAALVRSESIRWRQGASPGARFVLARLSLKSCSGQFEHFAETNELLKWIYPAGGDFSMSQEWDVLEFVERFRDGEFDGRIGEALELLSSEQIEDLRRLATDASWGRLES